MSALSDADYAQRMANRRQESANAARLRAAKIEAKAVGQLATAITRMETKLDAVLDRLDPASTERSSE